MKKIFAILIIGATVCILSCKKNVTDKPVVATPDTKTITPPEKPLSGEFKISSSDLYENQDVTMTPVDMRPGLSYHWSLGLVNGKKIASDEKSPVISYKMHGAYEIVLTVTNAEQETATSTQWLPVSCNWFGSGPHP